MKALTYPFEVLIYKLNKAEPKLAEKTAAGAAIQRQAPDFVRYAVEGEKVQDKTVSMSILEWTSFDGHMRFRASPLYPQFGAARQGAVSELISMTHYNFFGPLSSSAPVPVYEVIDLSLKPSASTSEGFPAFLSTIGEVLDILDAYPSSLGYNIGWQKEDPSKALVLIGWPSVEAHTEDFSKSGDAGYNKFVAKWKPAVASFFDVKELFHVKVENPLKAA